MSQRWGSEAQDEGSSFEDPFAERDAAEERQLTLGDIGGAGAGAAGGGQLTAGDLAAASAAATLSIPAFARASAAGAPDAGARAPAGGKAGAAAEEEGGAKFLAYERRGLYGQASYNVGYSYFAGLLVGGVYGAFAGVRGSPNLRPRVLLNALLNGSGKFGARAGNAIGVSAMIFTYAERKAEDLELDRLPVALARRVGLEHRLPRPLAHGDALIPAAAAFTTGALFVLPRALTMRGLERRYVSGAKRVAVLCLGGSVGLVGVGVASLVGPFLFGDRAPFRFAA